MPQFPTLRDLRELVYLVVKSDIYELELTWSGGHVRIRGQTDTDDEAPGAAEWPPFTPIVSPYVGTFRIAEEHATKPLVRVGDTVEPGQVVCFIEAMRILNAIESEVAGTVVEILFEDGHPIEAETQLMLIREEEPPSTQ